MTDLHTLAGAYALDALPDDERAFFERHLAECEGCQREVEEYHATAAVLGSAAVELPPAGLRERVLDRIDVTRQRQPIVTALEDRSPARSRLSAWLPAVAAGLAVAVVALSGVAIQLQRDVETVQQQVAELGVQDEVVEVLVADDVEDVLLDSADGADARLLHSPGLDRAVFVAEGLAALPDETVYELWLWHDGQPVPADLFMPGASGGTLVVIDGAVTGAEQVAVTVEPAGGVTAPTGPTVVAAGL